MKTSDATVAFKPELSFLDLIAICDNFRPNTPSSVDHKPSYGYETLTPFVLTCDPGSPVIGLLRPVIVELLRAEGGSTTTPGAWFIQPTDGPSGKQRVSLNSWVDTPSKRTAVLTELCERWRDTGLFPDVVGPRKWRAERYPVYRHPFGPHDAATDNNSDKGNYAFEMERSACALFGIVTYGVHMTMYHGDPSSLDVRIWVPTRAQSKQTWPGYLDNSVAGGIPSGMGIFDSLVKESMEEAGISENIIRSYARSTGSISYFFQTAEGWLQPEVEYVYDLRIPDDVDPAQFQPKPLDGEVEGFELLPLEEVVSRMRKGLFKPNCAVVLIDFLIRHGHLTPDNEPQFMEIITRLHGRFDYDKW